MTRAVVDADVASATSAATNPRSKCCRELLDAIESDGHSFVMTPQLKAEWNRRQSDYARTWRLKMLSTKRLTLITTSDDALVELVADSDALNSKQRAAALKDVHLVHAAAETDRAVFSMDRRARALFALLAESSVELASISWLNPEEESDDPVKWLAAKVTPQRCRLQNA
jgi:hypothetical protein